MLRQNRSEGSSTSRSFAKTALLRARRKTFQFSDEQCPRYIFLTEPLFLIPSVRTEAQNQAHRVATLFSREPLFLMPVRSSPSHRGSLANRVPGKASRSALRESLCVSLRGNHFSSFLPAATDIQRSSDRACRRLRTFCQGTAFPQSFRPRLLSRKPEDLDRRTIFRGNHFSLCPLVSRMPLAEPSDFPQQFFL
jgi:hypothetical protein